jgi:hypothetical protein
VYVDVGAANRLYDVFIKIKDSLDNICGVTFEPEKSGNEMLQSIIIPDMKTY